MKKRLLITGATGMLGATLVKHFQDEYVVYATGTSEAPLDFFENYLQFDLRLNDYSNLIDWSKPDFIIHSGALTNGNYCDQEPQDAFLVNGTSLKRLSESMLAGSKIIYISTDAVFPSSLHLAKETNCTNPESVYGKSKELGEFFLRNSSIDYTIVRTTIVGTNLNLKRSGFAEWILKAVKNDEEIGLFEDVVFTPISIWHLAEYLGIILKDNEEYSNKILHIAGGEICTKYDFGTALIESHGLSIKNVKRGRISEFKDRAKRSTDQTLDCTFFETKIGKKLPTLKETIEAFKIRKS